MSDLPQLADRLEAILPAIMRQLYFAREDEPFADLPLMQLRVVRSLSNGPRPVSCVGQELTMSPSRLAHLLARLEDAGLVNRFDDERDRRVRYAQLTPLGNDLMAKRRQMRRERAHHLLERLSPEERDQVMDALQLLLDRSGDLDAPKRLEPELEATLPA